MALDRSLDLFAHRFYVFILVFCFSYSNVQQTKLASSLVNFWAHYNIVCLIWWFDLHSLVFEFAILQQVIWLTWLTRIKWKEPTFDTLSRGWSWESFRAAASMELAAFSNSLSATTVGSYGSTHSEPVSTRPTQLQHYNLFIHTYLYSSEKHDSNQANKKKKKYNKQAIATYTIKSIIQ